VYYLTSRNTFDLRGRAESTEAEVTISPSEENFPVETFKNYGVNIFTTRYEMLFEAGAESEYADFLAIYKDFDFKTLRFPNGCHIAWYNWKDPDSSTNPAPTVEQVLQFAKDSDSELIFEMSTLGFLDSAIRDHKYTNPCGNEIEFRWSENDIRWFVQEYTVKRKAAGENYIEYYELGNEEWGYYNHDLQRMLTPAEYVNAAKAVSQIIKQEAPYVEIIGVSTWQDSAVWGAQEYINNPSFFDNVTLHTYWHDAWLGEPPEGESLFSIDWHIKPILDAYQQVFAGVEKFQRPAYTEWNLFCWPEGNSGRPHKNTMKFEHTLYILEHMLVQSEYNIKMTNYHEFHPLADNVQNYGGCNLVFKDGEEYGLSAAGIGLYTYSQHYAIEHVKTVVDSPIYSYEPYGYGEDFRFQSLFASSAKSDDKVHSIIINRNPEKDMETTINLADFSDEVKYDLYLLHAPALSSDKEEIKLDQMEKGKVVDSTFVIDIPKYSAVILEITKEECVSDCSSKVCGDDNGCGGKCTGCPKGEICNEKSWKCEKTVPSNSCSVADINGKENSPDGEVNAYDLSMVLSNWKCTTGPNCGKADIWGRDDKKDGQVGPFDLSRVLSCWKK